MTSKKCLKHPRNTFRTFDTVERFSLVFEQHSKVNSSKSQSGELTLELWSVAQSRGKIVQQYQNVRNVFLGCFKHFFDVKFGFSGRENIYIRYRIDQTLLNPPLVEIRNKSIFYSTQTRFRVLVVSDDQYIYMSMFMFQKFF